MSVGYRYSFNGDERPGTRPHGSLSAIGTLAKPNRLPFVQQTAGFLPSRAVCNYSAAAAKGEPPHSRCTRAVVRCLLVDYDLEGLPQKVECVAVAQLDGRRSLHFRRCTIEVRMVDGVGVLDPRS